MKSYKHFLRRPMPEWGGDMSEIFFDDIFYYIKPTDHQVDAWDDRNNKAFRIAAGADYGAGLRFAGEAATYTVDS